MTQHYSIHPTHPQPRLIREVAEVVRAGGVIAYPTDSGYALGCHVGDANATRRIRQIRGVDERHLLTLVLRDLAEIGRFARIDNWQFRIVRRGTPGGFTFILPATREVPRRLQHPKRRTIGIRVPAHPVVQALLAELDEPLLSSTLIPAGGVDPLNDADEILRDVGQQIDLVIDSGPCPALPTTVVDLSVEPGVVVRRGLGDPAKLGFGDRS